MYFTVQAYNMNLNLLKQINPAKNSKLNHQAYTPK